MFNDPKRRNEINESKSHTKNKNSKVKTNNSNTKKTLKHRGGGDLLNLLLPLNLYEFLPSKNEFSLHKKDKFAEWESVVIRAPATPSPDAHEPIPLNDTGRTCAQKRKWESVGVLGTAHGGYYFKEKKRVCTTIQSVKLSDDCSLDNIFHSILAFSDSCHDFKDLSRTNIYTVYKDNTEYTNDMEKLAKQSKSISEWYLANSLLNWSGEKRPLLDRPLLDLPKRNFIYLSQLNKLVNNFDTYDYSKVNTEEQNHANHHGEHDVGKNGPSTWEAPFLSKFYYSLFPVSERENIYKLNVEVVGWQDKLGEFLRNQGFKNYFFDMIIAQKEGLGEYDWTTMKRAIQNKDITQLDTVAKWWDPSSGGVRPKEFGDIKKFAELLKTEVLQKCGNVEFEDIITWTTMDAETSSNGEEINVFDEVVVTDNNNNNDESLYLKIRIDEDGNPTKHIYIQVFKENFTISNCIRLYNYIDNIKTPNNPTDTQKLIENNKNNLKLLVLSLKRSGDHGQVMHLKKHNEEKDKTFLITGDSLCAIKAMYEKVPVLFFKYHQDEKQKVYCDLYLYYTNFIPAVASYIQTHNIQLTITNPDNDIVNNDIVIKYENKKMIVSQGTENKNEDSDMEKLKLYKLYQDFTINYNPNTKSIQNKILNEAITYIKNQPTTLTRPETPVRVTRGILETNEKKYINEVSDQFEDVIRNTDIFTIYVDLFVDIMSLVGKHLPKKKQEILAHLKNQFQDIYGTVPEGISKHCNYLEGYLDGNNYRYIVIINGATLIEGPFALTLTLLKEKHKQLLVMLIDLNQKLDLLEYNNTPNPNPNPNPNKIMTAMTEIARKVYTNIFRFHGAPFLNK